MNGKRDAPRLGPAGSGLFGRTYAPGMRRVSGGRPTVGSTVFRTGRGSVRPNIFAGEPRSPRLPQIRTGRTNVTFRGSAVSEAPPRVGFARRESRTRAAAEAASRGQPMASPSSRRPPRAHAWWRRRRPDRPADLSFPPALHLAARVAVAPLFGADEPPPTWRREQAKPLWVDGQAMNSLMAAHRQFNPSALSAVAHYLWWLGKEVEAHAMQQVIAENKEFIYTNNSSQIISRSATSFNPDEKEVPYFESLVEDERGQLTLLDSNSTPFAPHSISSSHMSSTQPLVEGLLVSRPKAIATINGPSASSGSGFSSKNPYFPPLVRLVDDARSHQGGGAFASRHSTVQWSSEAKPALDTNLESLTLCESFPRVYTEDSHDLILTEEGYANISRPSIAEDHFYGEAVDTDEEDEAIRILNHENFEFKDLHNGLQFSDEWFEALEGANSSSSEQGFDCSCWAFSLEAVTSEGLIYSLGMLVDPVSERYVFDGVPFREEARVLHTSVNFYENPKNDGRNGAPEVAVMTKNVRMLLREYASISKSFGGGIIVQTFSLLPDEKDEEEENGQPTKEDEVDATAYQLVPPQKVQQLLWECLPGALTRAFTLAPYIILDAAAKNQKLRRKRNTSMVGSPMYKHDRERRLTPTLSLTGVLEEQSGDLAKLKEAELSSGKLEGVSLGARELLPIEALWRYKQPKLFKWAMLHDPAELQVAADLLINFALKLIKAQEQKRAVRKVLNAVGVIQRFLRTCVLKKRRALQKMLRQWRQLEVGSRFRLQYYRPLFSAAGQIETIINSFLQQHMVTSNNYKIELINELWDARRVAYREWVAKQALRDAFAYQHGSQQSRRTSCNSGRTSSAPSSVRDHLPSLALMDDIDKFIMWIREQSFASGPDDSMGVPTEDSSQLMSRMVSRLNEIAWPSWHVSKQSEASDRDSQRLVSENDEKAHSTTPSTKTLKTTEEGELPKEDVELSKKKLSFFQNVVLNKSTLNISSRARWQRQQDELHERFGWFIPPDDLLHESHQCLLAKLASSVLTREQTQHEIQRALQEVAVSRTSSTSGTEKLNQKMPLSSEQDSSIGHDQQTDPERTARTGGKGSPNTIGRSPLSEILQKNSPGNCSHNVDSASRKDIWPASRTLMPGLNDIGWIKGSKKKAQKQKRSKNLGKHMPPPHM